MTTQTNSNPQFIQQNLGRSKTAWAQLNDSIEEHNIVAAAIQEPYTYQHRIPSSNFCFAKPRHNQTESCDLDPAWR